jgi:MoaA/NifB/PqqE/SkfB family radical SAM enzyme
LKINIFLNNFLGHQNTQEALINIPLKNVQKIISSNDHQYILRGEPTLYPYLYETLDMLQGKNFIVTTSGYEPNVLINYKSKIPYLSLNYNGFLNDQNINLTANIIKLLNRFANNTEDVITRISYIISNTNLPWIKVDAEILVKFYDIYRNLKKPYFIIDQQTDIYNQKEFIWIPMGLETIKMLNHKGLLSEKVLNYLMAWIHKIPFNCTSLQNELICDWTGNFRTCMSTRFFEKIGDINNNTLQEIIDDTQEHRRNCINCGYTKSCWLAYHYKDNISNE